MVWNSDFTGILYFIWQPQPRQKPLHSPVRGSGRGAGKVPPALTRCTEQGPGSSESSGVETSWKTGLSVPRAIRKVSLSEDGAECGLQFLKNCSHMQGRWPCGWWGARWGRGAQVCWITVCGAVWSTVSCGLHGISLGLCSHGSWQDAPRSWGQSRVPWWP